MDERLRPTERLRSAGEFRRVFRRGRCHRTRYLRIHYAQSSRELSRLGLVVSRRVGNAVTRSRVKRLLRDVYRRRKGRISHPLDVVLVAQGGARAHREYVAAFEEFLESLMRSGEGARRPP
jgi:ribonuclease P protein component